MQYEGQGGRHTYHWLGPAILYSKGLMSPYEPVVTRIIVSCVCLVFVCMVQTNQLIGERNEKDG